MSELSLLESLKENDSINVLIEAKDWKEAIKKCFSKLVQNKKVDENYIKAIIDSTIEHGPYYIICPLVAMPHANPKFGSFADGFSLITLKKSVFFDNNEVKILIGFCAENDEKHLEIALPQIAAVFENTEVINDIANAKTKEEVISIIKDIDYMKYLR